MRVGRERETERSERARRSARGREEDVRDREWKGIERDRGRERYGESKEGKKGSGNVCACV